jgi:hypothetical protein
MKGIAIPSIPETPDGGLQTGVRRDQVLELIEVHHERALCSSLALYEVECLAPVAKDKGGWPRSGGPASGSDIYVVTD